MLQPPMIGMLAYLHPSGKPPTSLSNLAQALDQAAQACPKGLCPGSILLSIMPAGQRSAPVQAQRRVSDHRARRPARAMTPRPSLRQWMRPVKPPPTRSRQQPLVRPPNRHPGLPGGASTNACWRRRGACWEPPAWTGTLATWTPSRCHGTPPTAPWTPRGAG